MLNCTSKHMLKRMFGTRRVTMIFKTGELFAGPGGGAYAAIT